MVPMTVVMIMTVAIVPVNMRVVMVMDVEVFARRRSIQNIFVRVCASMHMARLKDMRERRLRDIRFEPGQPNA